MCGIWNGRILAWIGIEDFKGYRIRKISMPLHSIACPDD